MPRASALIGFDDIVDAYRVSPERLRRVTAQHALTGFPVPVRDGGDGERWDREAVEVWMAELVQAPQVAVLLDLKRAITVHTYAKKPGYFVAPDQVELTPGGLERKRWRRDRVLAWDATRTGSGNPVPSGSRRLPPDPEAEAGIDTSQETLSTAEVALLLGYANVSSLTSAYSQGLVKGIGEPAPPEAQSGRGGRSRRWNTQLVLQEAERRRGEVAGRRARVEVCLNALRVADGGPVSAVALHRSDTSGGTLQDWKKALDLARRQFKAG
jgi:predicted DNA-binding transcriptional regulator AlpA